MAMKLCRIIAGATEVAIMISAPISIASSSAAMGSRNRSRQEDPPSMVGARSDFISSDMVVSDAAVSGARVLVMQRLLANAAHGEADGAAVSLPVAIVELGGDPPLEHHVDPVRKIEISSSSEETIRTRYRGHGRQ